jgi:hypothetical protein
MSNTATPPIDLHRRLREVSGWVEDNTQIWSNLVKIVFWACLVVFLSAMFGVGYQPDKLDLDRNTTVSMGGIEGGRLLSNGLGWKGIDMGLGSGAKDIWSEVVVSQGEQIGSWRSVEKLEGIWDAERLSR